MSSNFIYISIISALLISATCLTAYEVLRHIWNYIPKWRVHPRLRTLVIMCTIFAIHIIGVWLYAIVFFVLENQGLFGTIQGNSHHIGWNWESFEDCLYLAASSYTTVGFGDVVPTQYLRMVSAACALNGLVMIGWTISFTYLALERFWTLPHMKPKQDR